MARSAAGVDGTPAPASASISTTVVSEEKGSASKSTEEYMDDYGDEDDGGDEEDDDEEEDDNGFEDVHACRKCTRMKYHNSDLCFPHTVEYLFVEGIQDQDLYNLFVSLLNSLDPISWVQMSRLISSFRRLDKRGVGYLYQNAILVSQVRHILDGDAFDDVVYHEIVMRVYVASVISRYSYSLLIL
jgi:hypothetical protein